MGSRVKSLTCGGFIIRIDRVSPIIEEIFEFHMQLEINRPKYNTIVQPSVP
jgi:hypothetical protein